MWVGACRWARVRAVRAGARTSQLLLMGSQVAASQRQGQGRDREAGSGGGQSLGAVARTRSRPLSCREGSQGTQGHVDCRTLFGNTMWRLVVSADHRARDTAGGAGGGVRGDLDSRGAVTASSGGAAQRSFAGEGCTGRQAVQGAPDTGCGHTRAPTLGRSGTGPAAARGVPVCPASALGSASQGPQ